MDDSPARTTASIPDKYSPDFAERLDRRTSIAKAIYGRIDAIESDLGGVEVLSHARRSLVRRVVWLEAIIEHSEQKLAAGESIDLAAHTQTISSLLGLYRLIGVDRRPRPIRRLHEVMAEGAATPCSASSAIGRQRRTARGGYAMKSLYECMLDPALFGRSFGADSFANWRAVAKMLDGLPLEPAELALWHDLTGRDAPPTAPFGEGYLIKPRRCGGTQFAGALGLHGALCGYRDRLGRGEVATIALIASDRRQARQLMNYVKGLIDDSPMIAAEVEAETTESITFAHRTQLEVHTTSFRSTRGYSYAAVILDELAFFRDDQSATPDIELVRAVRPGLANLGGRLLGLSSPHSRRGHLYAMYQQHYGKPSDVLVMSAGHAQLNPTIDPRVIERAMAEDPEAARSEWFGQFRDDIASFLSEELIEAATPGRLKSGSRLASVAFVDMSGGVSDASALAIAHSEAMDVGAPTVTLDRLQVVDAPHEPDTVVGEFARTLKSYGLHRVTGDKYAANWVVDAFHKYGITYEQSELDKSAIYTEVLPLFSEKRVELLDDRRLLTELRLLERKPRSGGRGDAVDHPPRGHDDAANAAAGALWVAQKESAGATRPDAIIKPELLLTAAKAPEQPAHVELVYAVVSASDRGDVGTVYFATGHGGSPGLYVLDWSIEQLQASSKWIRGVFERLALLRAGSRMHSSEGSDSIWFDSSSALACTLMHIGKDGNWNVYDAVQELAVGGALPDLTSRAAAALRFVASGTVKICRKAFEKQAPYRAVNKNHLLAQLGAFGYEEQATTSTELLTVFSLGVVLARRDAEGAGDEQTDQAARPAAPPVPPPPPGLHLQAGRRVIDGVAVDVPGGRGELVWWPLPVGRHVIDEKQLYVQKPGHGLRVA